MAPCCIRLCWRLAPHCAMACPGKSKSANVTDDRTVKTHPVLETISVSSRCEDGTLQERTMAHAVAAWPARGKARRIGFKSLFLRSASRPLGRHRFAARERTGKDEWAVQRCRRWDLDLASTSFLRGPAGAAPAGCLIPDFIMDTRSKWCQARKPKGGEIFSCKSQHQAHLKLRLS